MRVRLDVSVRVRLRSKCESVITDKRLEGHRRLDETAVRRFHCAFSRASVDSLKYLVAPSNELDAAVCRVEFHQVLLGVQYDGIVGLPPPQPLYLTI